MTSAGGERLDVAALLARLGAAPRRISADSRTIAAGDAFAAGFIYGLAQGWNYYKAARMGNAGGAIVVTRHGCANFMAYEDEALKFIDERGGF